ncbi:MAG: hypothetical protein ACTS68_00665 [Candidatus Hodgkinia cicadicola]
MRCAWGRFATCYRPQRRPLQLQAFKTVGLTSAEAAFKPSEMSACNKTLRLSFRRPQTHSFEKWPP